MHLLLQCLHLQTYRTGAVAIKHRTHTHTHTHTHTLTHTPGATVLAPPSKWHTSLSFDTQHKYAPGAAVLPVPCAAVPGGAGGPQSSAAQK